MTVRRILVVTYAYPPMPSVGGNRWLAMAKYLRRAGHDVTILTTAAFGRLRGPEEAGVVRADDLMAAPWLRALLRRPPLPVAGEVAPVDKPVPGVITRVIVPDHYLATWVPFAIRAARAIHRERALDCLITTSAYESIHAVGLAFGRSRPPWVADFRDGWTFHPWKEPFPTRVQARLDSLMEAHVVRGAERVVAVERPVRDDFRARLGVDAAHVPNGWDPELDGELCRGEVPELPAGRVTLVHTGRMLGPWGRSPRPLLEGLARLRARQPELASRLLLVLAGRRDRAELELLDGYDLDGLVRHVGQLSRGGALALQRQADVLILLTAPDLVWELPGKVFEYIGARRPILALARGNEAAHVVEETATGLTVSPDDIEGIAAALAAAARGSLVAAYRPKDLERYVYPAPARAMEAEIERAIRLRRAARIAVAPGRAGPR
jgi:glycosyltransferase involved in cell wall biosynthesis